MGVSPGYSAVNRGQPETYVLTKHWFLNGLSHHVVGRFFFESLVRDGSGVEQFQAFIRQRCYLGVDEQVEGRSAVIVAATSCDTLFRHCDFCVGDCNEKGSKHFCFEPCLMDFHGASRQAARR